MGIVNRAAIRRAPRAVGQRQDFVGRGFLQFRRHRPDERLEGRTRLIRIGHAAIAAQRQVNLAHRIFSLFFPTLARIERVGHGEDFAALAVDDHQPPAPGMVFLDGVGEMALRKILDHQIDGEPHILAIMAGGVIGGVDPQSAAADIAQERQFAEDRQHSAVENHFIAALAGVLEADFADDSRRELNLRILPN